MNSFIEIPSLSFGEHLYRSKNRLIEGDNLEVLAVLPPESVDLICTDPPYGTGKQFRYNDNWTKYTPNPMEEVYTTFQEVGRHAPWMNFMANRLRLMRRLLKPSGVIAISIGKEGFFRLGVLMDDLFGEDNCLGIINWQKRYSSSNDSRHISDTTDYVLLYKKERHIDQRLSVFAEQGNTLWGIDDPCFDLDRLKVGDIPLLAFPSSWYQSPFEIGCQSWPHEQSGHNQDATKLLNAIMGNGHARSTPKPLKLLKKIIHLWCPMGGLVLDVFAGSATTGHALLELNATTHAERSFLLVEQGNPQTQDLFTRTLTAERLRRVISGEWATSQHPPLHGGFTFQYLKKASPDQGVEECLKEVLLEAH